MGSCCSVLKRNRRGSLRSYRVAPERNPSAHRSTQDEVTGSHESTRKSYHHNKNGLNHNNETANQVFNVNHGFEETCSTLDLPLNGYKYKENHYHQEHQAHPDGISPKLSFSHNGPTNHVQNGDKNGRRISSYPGGGAGRRGRQKARRNTSFDCESTSPSSESSDENDGRNSTSDDERFWIPGSLARHMGYMDPSSYNFMRSNIAGTLPGASSLEIPASSQPVQELQLDPNKLKVPDNLERVSMKTNLDSGQVFNNLLVGASPGLPSITSSVLPAIGSPPPNRILPPSFLDDVLDELDDVTSAKPDTTNESNPANDHFDDKVPSNVHNVKENDDHENNHELQNGNSYIAIGNESENVIISHHQNEDNELIQNVDETYITNGMENENTPEDNENDEKLSQKSVYLGGSAPSSGRESQTSLSTHIVMVKPSSCSDNDNDEAVENYNAALDDPCNESANDEKVEENQQTEIFEKPTTPKIDKSPEKIVEKIESLDEIVEGDDISLVSEVSHLTSPRVTEPINNPTSSDSNNEEDQSDSEEGRIRSTSKEGRLRSSSGNNAMLANKPFVARITGEWGLETGGLGGDTKQWVLDADKAGATKQWSIDTDSIVMCNSVTISSRKSVESLVEPKWSSVEDRLTENNGNHDQDIRTVSPITQIGIDSGNSSTDSQDIHNNNSINNLDHNSDNNHDNNPVNNPDTNHDHSSANNHDHSNNNHIDDINQEADILIHDIDTIDDLDNPVVVEINHDNHQVIKLDGLKNTKLTSKDAMKDISFDMDEIDDKSEDDNANDTQGFYSDIKSAKKGLKEVQSEPEEILLGRSNRESSDKSKGRIRRNSFHMYLEDLAQ